MWDTWTVCTSSVILLKWLSIEGNFGNYLVTQNLTC